MEIHANGTENARLSGPTLACESFFNIKACRVSLGFAKLAQHDHTVRGYMRPSCLWVPPEVQTFQLLNHVETSAVPVRLSHQPLDFTMTGIPASSTSSSSTIILFQPT